MRDYAQFAAALRSALSPFGEVRVSAVHVEEAIATAAEGARNLELRSFGVVATC